MFYSKTIVNFYHVISVDKHRFLLLLGRTLCSEQIFVNDNHKIEQKVNLSQTTNEITY